MTTSTNTMEIRPLPFDLVMARYLPASPNGLRDIIRERTGVTHDFHTVTEGLAILADLDYPA